MNLRVRRVTGVSAMFEVGSRRRKNEPPTARICVDNGTETRKEREKKVKV